jgi:hypothetical protein
MSVCIDDVMKWLYENDLMCNGGKTDFTICGTPPQLAKLDNPSIAIGSHTIYPSDRVRNLGVIFDKNLAFEAHISQVSKSAYYQLYNINRKRKCLTMEAAKLCIHAFVTSKLDCCNSLLYGLGKCHTARLQKVQNAAARALTFTKKYDHITPVLKDLHWLPVRRRVEFKVLVFAFKAFHGTAPDYLVDLINPYKPPESLRSAGDTFTLQDTRHRKNLKSGGDRAFSHAAPMLWNKLPFYIRSSETLSVFKSRLKTYLFRQEFD